MEFIYGFFKKYWYLFLGGLILILIILFQLWMFYYFNSKDDNALEESVVMVDSFDEEEKEEVIQEYLYVDIKGKVKKPGVYKLSLGSRVNDVINAAGGLLGDADTSVTNLSLKIVDEMVIVIYSKDEVNDFKKIKEEQSLVVDGCFNEEKIKNDTCVTIDKEDVNVEKENLNNKISINSASIEELMKLPGVGESKAKSIVEYRNNNGEFEKIEDLLNVSGIGEKLFEDIKEHITL